MKVGCRHGDNNVSLDMLKQCEPYGCQHEHDDKPKEKYIDHCRKDLSTKQNSWRLHVYFDNITFDETNAKKTLRYVLHP